MLAGRCKGLGDKVTGNLEQQAINLFIHHRWQPSSPRPSLFLFASIGNERNSPVVVVDFTHMLTKGMYIFLPGKTRTAICTLLLSFQRISYFSVKKLVSAANLTDVPSSTKTTSAT